MVFYMIGRRMPDMKSYKSALAGNTVIPWILCYELQLIKRITKYANRAIV